MSRRIINIVMYLLAVPGSVLLVYWTLTSLTRSAARWIRIAIWLAVPAVLGWSFTGLLLLFKSVQMPERLRLFLNYWEGMFAGAALAILLLLLLSGALIKKG